MRQEEILEQLRRVMANLFQLAPAEIRPESRLGPDLDIDSIDAIDLLIKMQELSQQKVDQDSIRDIRTVEDIVHLIEHLESQSA